MKKRPYLVLILTAILTVVCQCSMTNREVKLAGQACKFTGTYDTDKSTYDGTFDCKNPDGSMLICPYTNQPVTNSKVLLLNESSAKISDQEFWARLGCTPAGQASSTPTSQPTATATFAPTATPAALLSGEVTACNLKDKFINFRLAAVSPLVSESDLHLTINGTQVNCLFAGSDNSLLSCQLPVEVTFPAQIHVAIGDTSTDDFTYDGAGCITQTGPANGDGSSSSGGGVPAPCVGDVCPSP